MPPGPAGPGGVADDRLGQRVLGVARIGTENTAATRNRFRISRTIASIDMPASPPWPIISCADGRPSPAVISGPAAFLVIAVGCTLMMAMMMGGMGHGGGDERS